MKTLQQFTEAAAKQGYNTAREFDNIFLFMDFCYKCKLTPTNSLVHIKEDGSGCFIAF